MKYLSFILLVFCSLYGHAQDGTLDSSFATNGMLILSDTASASKISFNTIAKKNANKIFLVGNIGPKNTSASDIIVQKLNLDGTSDNTFGTFGKVIIGSSVTNEYGRDIMILPDGKIIIGADYGNGTFLIIKLKSNGVIDSTFGINGQTSFATSGLTLNKVLVQSTGKLIIHTTSGSVFRLTTNGSLDATFGTSGVLSAFDLLTLDLNDRILSTPFYRSTSNTTILRYTANGILDNTYGSNGGTVAPATHWGGYNIYGLETDSLNGAIITGSFVRAYSRSFPFENFTRFLSRFDENGIHDITYGIIAPEPTWSLSWTPGFQKNNNLLIQSNRKPIVVVYNNNAMPQPFGGVIPVLCTRIDRYYYPPKLAETLPTTSFKNDPYFTNNSFYPPTKIIGSSFIRGDASLIEDNSFYVLITTSMGSNLYKFKTSSSAVAYPKPIANFSANATTGIPSSTIFTLTNTSTQNPTSYQWSFTPNNVTYSAGTNSTSQNPKVVFTQPGKYDVKLVVQNIFGVDSLTKTNYITINALPKALFYSNRVLSDTNSTIQLFDTSLNYPSSRVWTITPNFFQYMNGTNANSASPIIRFKMNGIYTIKIKSMNNIGADSITKTDYITVTNPFAAADFTASSVKGDTSKVFQFSDKSITTTDLAYNWSFTPNSVSYINGTSSASQNPVVKFNAYANYSVKLGISGNMVADSISKLNYITVSSSLGIPSNEIYTNGIHVFPNPASQYIAITSDGVEMNKIEIKDITGRLVYSHQNIKTNNHIIQLYSENFQSGVYFISIFSDKGIAHQKIMVE